MEPQRFARCRMAVCSLTGQKWIAEHQGQVRSDVLAHSAGPVLCQDDFQQGNVLAVRQGREVPTDEPVNFGTARADLNQRTRTEVTSARRQSRAATNPGLSGCYDHWAKNPTREAEKSRNILVAPSTDHGTVGNLRRSGADSGKRLSESC